MLKAAKGFGKKNLIYKKETIDICCDYLENWNRHCFIFLIKFSSLMPYVVANCTDEDPRYESKYMRINKCVFFHS